VAESPSTLSVFYKGWNDYQDLLTKALAPLSPEQLTLRAGPNLRSIGEIATHMIGARARWFHNLMGEGGDDFAAMAAWDRPGMAVRTAAELVRGLENTWQVMQEALARWTPAEWEQTYEEEDSGERYSFTRQWVIWHLIEHDLHHGGEISLTLGMHGLTAPDL
jgi:uncharacterized damage-inducible protein DinB